MNQSMLAAQLRSWASPAAAVFALLMAESAEAQVHRCTDAVGKVTYQSQPCPESSAARAVPSGQTQVAPPKVAPATRRLIPEMQGGGISAPDGSVMRAPQPLRTSVAPPAPELIRDVPAPRQRVLAPAAAAQGASQWGKGADVLVVSGYEFSDSATQVHVNHPEKPVLLVLTSHHSTKWRVLPAPGTTLRAVIVASHEERSTVQAPPQVPVLYDELPYAVETGNLNFRELISKLAGRYAIDKVTAFRGGYSLPALVPVKGPYVPDPALTLEGLRPEVPRARFSFELLSIDGRRLPWTNTGPKDGKRYTGIVRGGGVVGGNAGPAVVSENGGEAYALEGNGSTLLWFPTGFNGPKRKVAVPRHLPELSWGTGMVWNTRKGVLAMVSLGGEGYFYRYDTTKKEWLDARSLRNKDLQGLALDAATGAYLSISDSAELLVFNEQGDIDEVLSLAKLLPDLDSTYDKGNQRLQGLMVAAHGGLVAILNVRNGSVTHIWTYEMGSRKAQLTYKVID